MDCTRRAGCQCADCAAANAAFSKPSGTRLADEFAVPAAESNVFEISEEEVAAHVNGLVVPEAHDDAAVDHAEEAGTQPAAEETEVAAVTAVSAASSEQAGTAAEPGSAGELSSWDAAEEKAVGGAGKGYDLSALESADAYPHPHPQAGAAASGASKKRAPQRPGSASSQSSAGSAGSSGGGDGDGSGGDGDGASTGSAESAGAAAAAAAASALPLAERLSSKSGPLRRNAYVELTKALQCGAALDGSAGEALTGRLLLSAVNDSVQLNSEAGMQLLAAATAEDSGCATCIAGLGKELMAAVVAKGLTSGKGAVADAAVDAAVRVLQLEGLDCGIADVVAGVKSMAKPKLVRSCARALARLMPSFGRGTRAHSDAIMAALPTLLLSTDKAVAPAALELAQAARKLLPAAVASMVAEYGSKKDGFSPELCAALGGGADAGGAAAAAEDGSGARKGSFAAAQATDAGAGAAAQDPFLVEEQQWDLQAEAWRDSEAGAVAGAVEGLKIEDKWTGTWKEKTPVLDALLALLAKHHRIAGDSHTYVSTLAILRRGLKDSNNVVVCKCLEAHVSFAARLQAGFGHAAKLALTDVAARLKEKRGSALTSAITCLRAFVRFQCLDVSDIAEEVAAGSEAWRKAGADFRKNAGAALCSIVGSQKVLPDAVLQGSQSAVSSRIKTLLQFIDVAVADASPEVKYEAERLLGLLIARLTTPKRSGDQHPDIVKVMQKLEESNKASAERVKVHAGLVEASGSVGATDALARAKQAGAAKSFFADPAAAAATTVAAPAPAAAKPPAAPSSKAGSALPPRSRAASGTSTASAGGGSVASTASTRSAGGASVASAAASVASTGTVDVAWEAAIAEEGGSVPSLEDAAAALLAAGLPGYTDAVAAQLDSPSSAWAAKKDALLALAAGIEQAGATSHIENAVSVIAGKTNNFKGLNNPSLLIACASALERLAKACTKASDFPRRAARVILDGLLPSLKERKGSAEIGAMALALAVACGPCYIAHRLMAAGASDKATPGVITAVAELLGTVIQRHGIWRVPPTPIVAHLAGSAGLQAPHAKQAAIASLVTIYTQMGPPLLALLSSPRMKFNLSELLLKSLKAEFDKAGYEPAAARALLEATTKPLGEKRQPSITLHGEAPPAQPADGDDDLEEGGAGASAIPGLPKADALSLLPRGIVADLDMEKEPEEGKGKPRAGPDADKKPWQIRMAAVENVAAVMTDAAASGGIIANESVVTLLKLLRKRLADVQANIRPRACAAIAALARAVGPAIGGCAKGVITGLLDTLSDKKDVLRKAALDALDAIVTDSSRGGVAVQQTVCAVFTAVLTGGYLGSPAGGREEILPWLSKYAPLIVRNATSLQAMQALAPPALDCLADKTPHVRKAAAELVTHCVRIAGPELVRSCLQGMKPSHRVPLEEQVAHLCEAGKALAAADKAAAANGGAARGGTGGSASSLASTASSRAESVASADEDDAPAPAPAPARGASKAATLGATTGKALSATSSAASDGVGPGAAAVAVLKRLGGGYALQLGPPAAKTVRVGMRDHAKYAPSREADSTGNHARLYKDLASEWDKVRVASPDLFADLFFQGDRAPDKNGAAMAWLASELPANPDALQASSDLIIKYIAVQLLEPRGKPSVLAAATHLLDVVLSAASRHGWCLSRYEGDVLMPVLCERAAATAGAPGASEPRSKLFTLMSSAVFLLSVVADYQPGGPGSLDGVAAVLETYVTPRVLDRGTKPGIRAGLLALMAHCVRVKHHARPVKRSVAAQLVRLVERDGTKATAPEVRAALLDLCGALYIVLGRNKDAFYKHVTLDARSAAASGAVGGAGGAAGELDKSIKGVLEAYWKRVSDGEDDSAWDALHAPPSSAASQAPDVRSRGNSSVVDGIDLNHVEAALESIASAAASSSSRTATGPASPLSPSYTAATRAIRDGSIEAGLGLPRAGGGAAAGVSKRLSDGMMSPARPKLASRAGATGAGAGAGASTAATAASLAAADAAPRSPTAPKLKSVSDKVAAAPAAPALPAEAVGLAPAVVNAELGNASLSALLGSKDGFNGATIDKIRRIPAHEMLFSVAPEGLPSACPMHLSFALTALRKAARLHQVYLSEFSLEFKEEPNYRAGLEQLQALINMLVPSGKSPEERLASRELGGFVAEMREEDRAALLACIAHVIDTCVIAMRAASGFKISNERGDVTPLDDSYLLKIVHFLMELFLLEDCALAVPQLPLEALLTTLFSLHVDKRVGKDLKSRIQSLAMRIVFRARRDRLVAIWLGWLTKMASWEPTSTAEPLPIRGNLLSALITTGYRLITYDLKPGSRSQSWSTNDLSLVVEAFKTFFDAPVISGRAYAVIFGYATQPYDPRKHPTAAAAAAAAATPLKATVSAATGAPLPASGGAAVNPDGSPVGWDLPHLKVPMHEDKRRAIRDAIETARDLFVGVVGQLGLALEPTLRKAGVHAHDTSRSFTRLLYHAILTAMATAQGQDSLHAVKPMSGLLTPRIHKIGGGGAAEAGGSPGGKSGVSSLAASGVPATPAAKAAAAGGAEGGGGPLFSPGTSHPRLRKPGDVPPSPASNIASQMWKVVNTNLPKPPHAAVLAAAGNPEAPRPPPALLDFDHAAEAAADRAAYLLQQSAHRGGAGGSGGGGAGGLFNGAASAVPATPGPAKGGKGSSNGGAGAGAGGGGGGIPQTATKIPQMRGRGGGPGSPGYDTTSPAAASSWDSLTAPTPAPGARGNGGAGGAGGGLAPYTPAGPPMTAMKVPQSSVRFAAPATDMKQAPQLQMPAAATAGLPASVVSAGMLRSSPLRMPQLDVASGNSNASGIGSGGGAGTGSGLALTALATSPTPSASISNRPASVSATVAAVAITASGISPSKRTLSPTRLAALAATGATTGLSSARDPELPPALVKAMDAILADALHTDIQSVKDKLPPLVEMAMACQRPMPSDSGTSGGPLQDAFAAAIHDRLAAPGVSAARARVVWANINVLMHAAPLKKTHPLVVRLPLALLSAEMVAASHKARAVTATATAATAATAAAVAAAPVPAPAPAPPAPAPAPTPSARPAAAAAAAAPAAARIVAVGVGPKPRPGMAAAPPPAVPATQ